MTCYFVIVGNRLHVWLSRG